MKKVGLALLGMALVAASGCVGTPHTPDAAPDRDAEGPSVADQEKTPPPRATTEQPKPASVADTPPSEPVQFSGSFQGQIVWRLAADEDPFTKYEGDPPCWYFLVPQNTTEIAVTLEWDTPQNVGFELHPPEGERYKSWGNAVVEVVPDSSPDSVRIKEPVPGQWFYWVGPLSAGANVNWKLTLSWTVASADATLEETLYQGSAGMPCQS